MSLQFEWDTQKAELNYRKHRVSFIQFIRNHLEYDKVLMYVRAGLGGTALENPKFIGKTRPYKP